MRTLRETVTDLPATRSAEEIDSDRRALGNDEADVVRRLLVSLAVGGLGVIALAFVLPRHPAVPATFGIIFGLAAATFAWLMMGRRAGRLVPALLYGAAYGAATWAFFHYTMRR